MDVPQPEELDGIGVVRHSVETRKKQRVHLSERFRMTPEVRHAHGTRLKLVEPQCVRKQPRAGDLPMQIEVIKRCAGPRLDVVPLWFRQFRVTLRCTTPPAGREHGFASIERLPPNQEVHVDPWSKM